MSERCQRTLRFVLPITLLLSILLLRSSHLLLNTTVRAHDSGDPRADWPPPEIQAQLLPNQSDDGTVSTATTTNSGRIDQPLALPTSLPPLAEASTALPQAQQSSGDVSATAVAEQGQAAQLPVAPTAASPSNFPEPSVGTPTTVGLARSAVPPSTREYTVKPGDQLVVIADRFGISIDAILNANGLSNPERIQIGQVLHIPLYRPTIPDQSAPSTNSGMASEIAPAEKIVPDSEAVYSSAYADFSVSAFVERYQGFLSAYRENVDGTTLSGAQIVQLIAERFSVGPRVLLALLEMHGGWVTGHGGGQLGNPFGTGGPSNAGLYQYLFYTASYLNEGYYAKATGMRNVIELHDGRRVMLAATVNSGTAAVQDAIGHEVSHDNWLTLLGPHGFGATYQRLFGDLAQYAVEPLVPPDLKQPPMRLPFEDGMRWFFTSGPHAAWADGSARAALDFGAPDRGATCEASDVWVLAVAPGVVVASEHGRVMVNLGGNRFQGSGWTVMYMHMATRDRPPVGTQLKMGDHLGHASCEGGAATASHLHVARLYNGQWIAAAARQAPMNLSGWIAKELPKEYEGFLVRNGEARMADAVRGRGVNAIYGEGIPPDLN